MLVRLLRLLLPTGILLASAVGMVLSGTQGRAATASATTTITIQSMDSCKQALDGAGYLLTGDNVRSGLTVTSSGSGRQSVSGGSCPVPRGSCRSTSTGCLSFTGVPAPGSYRIHAVVTPPANSSNPEGYAPCEGGSACRSEEAVVTVLADGSVQAQVNDVYPDGFIRVLPGSSSTYAGTAADPIVFHLFGLGSGSCDGDHDADDHLTGSPSSHCSYSPESGESSACQPYPWSCAFSTTTTSTTSTGTSTSSSTTTTTTSTTDTTTTGTTTTTTTTDTTTTSTTTSPSTTSTTTTTTSTSTAPACTTDTFTGTAGSSGTTSNYVQTTASGPLTASVTWSPTAVVTLIVYDSSLNELGRSPASSSSPQTVTLPSVAPGRYKIKVKDSSSPTVTFTLSVTHC
jgi:hypothetical protein